MPDTLHRALRHHQQGQLDEAARLYHAVLAAQPGHLEALHLLGVVAHQKGDHARAVELIGRAVAIGPQAKGVTVGQPVGVGWGAASCMHCHQCLSGDQNLCAQNVPTIVGHKGGFADRLRVQWPWAIPLPEGLNKADAGPLLCGGTTVFGPLLVFGVKPTDRVGVVGIGGLGHLALKFAKAWGCEVTGFASTDAKADEARSFGAHHVVNRERKATFVISRARSISCL